MCIYIVSQTAMHGTSPLWIFMGASTEQKVEV